jgi:hypothetical protein
MMDYVRRHFFMLIYAPAWAVLVVVVHEWLNGGR